MTVKVSLQKVTSDLNLCGNAKNRSANPVVVMKKFAAESFPKYLLISMGATLSLFARKVEWWSNFDDRLSTTALIMLGCVPAIALGYGVLAGSATGMYEGRNDNVGFQKVPDEENPDISQARKTGETKLRRIWNGEPAGVGAIGGAIAGVIRAYRRVAPLLMFMTIVAGPILASRKFSLREPDSTCIEMGLILAAPLAALVGIAFVGACQSIKNCTPSVVGDRCFSSQVQLRSQ